MRVDHPRFLVPIVVALSASCAGPPRPTPSIPPAPGATRADAGVCNASRTVPHRDVIERRVAHKRGTMGRARTNMVATSHTLATAVGREVLARGGNAVDAYVASVLTEDVVLPGVTSTAGITGFLVGGHGVAPQYVHGPYRTPPRAIAGYHVGDPPGREVLLPGAPFALLEAQARWGRLPLADVLAPVIRLAREGFAIDALDAAAIAANARALRSSPYGAQTYFHDDAPLGVGAVLRLPEVAATLERVARNGVDEFRRGEWARAFVAEVNRQGGALEPSDMEALRAVIAPAARGSYRGRTVYASSAGSYGGRALLLALAVLEHADIARMGPPERSAATLALLVHTQRATAVRAEPWLLDASVTGEALGARLRARSDAIWTAIERGEEPRPDVAWGGHHSSAVVVVDRDGLVVAGTHTIETTNWGRAIFVGGFPLGTVAAHAPGIDRVAPGDPVPDPLSVALVEEDGVIRIAESVYGTGLNPADVQILSHLIDHGRTPEDAVLAPRLGFFVFDLTRMQGDVTRNLLDPRFEPRELCELGPLGATLVQEAMPGYPPGVLDLGFPTVVQVRGDGAAREILGMTPEWMEGVAAGD
jgi:gamma-glutamyltranspeptidase/glutathione hydrolase